MGKKIFHLLAPFVELGLLMLMLYIAKLIWG